MLSFASLCPHPPIIIPGIGSDEDLDKVSETVKSMKILSEKVAVSAPDILIIISPHAPTDYGQFSIFESETFQAQFYRFGEFDTRIDFSGELRFASLLKSACRKENLTLRSLDDMELDHGSSVPLYHLSLKYSGFKVLPAAFSLLSVKDHFRFGRIMGSEVKKNDSRIGIVASGDLSHRLTPSAPAGYSPKGADFDGKIASFLKNKDIKGIMNMDPRLIEEAGECGYRSLIILLGFLSEFMWEPEILSYEAPFGVGYLTVGFEIK